MITIDAMLSHFARPNTIRAEIAERAPDAAKVEAVPDWVSSNVNNWQFGIVADGELIGVVYVDDEPTRQDGSYPFGIGVPVMAEPSFEAAEWFGVASDCGVCGLALDECDGHDTDPRYPGVPQPVFSH